MINLELYRIFVIVAEEGNLTKASDILHISQPAVTKQIKNLERELNTVLFIRSKQGMELSKEGNKLYIEIKDAVKILEEAQNKYIGFRNINLGVHATMLNKIFSKSIAKYYQENESVKINIINKDIKEMICDLENQELDIVLSKKINEKYYDKNKVTYIPLGNLHDILIASNNTKYKNKIITIDELKEAIIYTPRKTSSTTMRFMEKFDIDENKVKNITYSTMLQILKGENEIGLATKEYIENEIDLNKITILKTDFEIEPMEFGMYLNNNRFKELNTLIKIIKKDFKI